MRRILSNEKKINIVFREEKKNYCTGKDCILIDDLEKNIVEWESNGGTGIVFKDAKTLMDMIADIEDK